MRYCLKITTIFLSACFAFGCVYDPAPEVIEIENKSKNTILVSGAFSDSLPFFPKLILVGNFDKGHEIVQYTPEYVIKPDSTGWVVRPVFPVFNETDKKYNLYFLTDSIIINNSWADIYKKQLFVKKYTYTEEELEKMNWKIIYK